MLLIAINIVSGSGRAVAADRWMAPSVELRGPKGTPARLSDFKGKIVLVKFWASWCPQCAEVFASLDGLDRDYRARGVEVIAVNVDEHRSNADAFLKAHPSRVRVLFDARARAFAAFGASGVPASFLIDRRGVIRHSHEGDTDVSPREYREEIDALLAESPR
ncbi:MAG TPA: TlpA disulfide reductase family protein [Vicinamibacterales bacterium]|nr:TlpA disulfide reductase family protein [Vicinamibacterales bacterium]